jgi:DNA-binding response OmpR family regulator
MPKKVLCVDDDPAITELLSMLLQTQGFEVFTSNSGEDGIKKIRDKSLHIVILDLMMPGVDGWQVCKKVREFSNVPIIILSALNDPDMIARALDAGADDYLVKPISSNVLVAHINRLIRRTGDLEFSSLNSVLSPPTNSIAP